MVVADHLRQSLGDRINSYNPATAYAARGCVYASFDHSHDASGA
jgi:hypothetical protein